MPFIDSRLSAKKAFVKLSTERRSGAKVAKMPLLNRQLLKVHRLKVLASKFFVNDDLKESTKHIRWEGASLAIL